MLYLDAPVGVGFSYSNCSGERAVGWLVARSASCRHGRLQGTCCTLPSLFFQLVHVGQTLTFGAAPRPFCNPPSAPADDYKQLATDKGMAADVVAFIREWRKVFPRLAAAPFWLDGESYAGGRGMGVLLPGACQDARAGGWAGK